MHSYIVVVTCYQPTVATEPVPAAAAVTPIPKDQRVYSQTPIPSKPAPNPHSQPSPTIIHSLTRLHSSLPSPLHLLRSTLPLPIHIRITPQPPNRILHVLCPYAIPPPTRWLTPLPDLAHAPLTLLAPLKNRTPAPTLRAVPHSPAKRMVGLCIAAAAILLRYCCGRGLDEGRGRRRGCAVVLSVVVSVSAARGAVVTAGGRRRAGWGVRGETAAFKTTAGGVVVALKGVGRRRGVGGHGDFFCVRHGLELRL